MTTTNIEIILDVRELDLIQRFEAKQSYPFSTKALDLGDVAFLIPSAEKEPGGGEGERGEQEKKETCVLFERKTLRDLLASLSDGRYEEQSHRLLNASGIPPHNIVYIIEGLLSPLGETERDLVYSCITSLSLFKGFSVYRTSTVQETADLLIQMANKLSRDMFHKRPPRQLAVQKRTAEEGDSTSASASYSSLVKKVKKENITDENIGVIMLTQIPGVSAAVAEEIFKTQSFTELIQWCKTDPDHALCDVKVKTTTNKTMKLKSNVRQAILHYVQKL